MDLCNKTNFGFTFTIPPFKKILYKNPCETRKYYRSYKTLSQADQKRYLEWIMFDTFTKYHNDIFYIFEQHEDKRLHIHGYIKDICEQEMIELQCKFYNLVGIRDIRKYSKISDIRELNNIDNWIGYLIKNPIYPTGIENELFSKYCDYGIVKIETRADIDYCGQVNTPERKYAQSPDYLFGKNKYKYIVDI